MTAAHYIALLLLSTAVEGSPDHAQIIVQNGPGIWLSLSSLNLVEREPEQVLWVLTGRGRALIEHILGLPLPEQVTSWQMPGASQQSTATSIQEAMRRWNESGVPAAAPPNLQPVNADSEDDGPPPPKPPPPKPIPGITPAEDPQARRDQARDLMNRGYGTSEIADTLEMSQSEVEQIFFGGV